MDTEQLRARIENVNAGNERLYGLDYLGRLWLAQLLADATVIADELDKRLEQASGA